MSRRLRKSEIRDLDQQLPISLSKKDEVVEQDDVLLINNRLSFIKISDEWIPALPLLLEDQLLPELVVDMGAVRFVVNGADIMRPGITEVPDVQKEGLVCVVDERNRKPLAVGRAKYAGDKMRLMDEGNVVESLHHVDDNWWNTYSN